MTDLNRDHRRGCLPIACPPSTLGCCAGTGPKVCAVGRPFGTPPWALTCGCSVTLFLLCCFGLSAGNAFADPSVERVTVEVFTSTRWPAFNKKPTPDGIAEPVFEMTVYEIDGVQIAERVLSRDLPFDQTQSNRLALKRLQNLDDETAARLRLAAMGLAKALHYGIDRYPAVVFDGGSVVYGVTDLTVAIHHYRQWRARQATR